MKYVDSIHKKAFETGQRYSQIDFDRYSKTFPIVYLAPGFNYIDYRVDVDETFKIQRFLIYFYLGTSLFVEQLIFLGNKSTEKNLQKERLFLGLNGIFKFKLEKIWWVQ